MYGQWGITTNGQKTKILCLNRECGINRSLVKNVSTKFDIFRKYLETFLAHGEIEISNNQVENAIRPFVVGRKGWLFSDTPRGAIASAVVYSLMETAKANGLNVNEYIFYLLTTLPDKFETGFVVDDYLPWADDMQKQFKMK